MTVAPDDVLLEPDDWTSCSASGSSARSGALTWIGISTLRTFTAFAGSARTMGCSCSSPSEESAKSKVTRFFLRTGEPSRAGGAGSSAGFGGRAAGDAVPSGDDGITIFRFADGRGGGISTAISTLRFRLRIGEDFCARARFESTTVSMKRGYEKVAPL